MPERTVEIPTEAILDGVDAWHDAHGLLDDQVRAILVAAVPHCTAPLLRELEEAKRKTTDEKFLRETENHRERKDKEAAEARADQLQQQLVELRAENEKLHRVFTAGANAIFWASDEDQLREKLVNLRDSIIAFNQPALATLHTQDGTQDQKDGDS